eukprot:7907919-Prorocentrum_lima.AAC.1
MRTHGLRCITRQLRLHARKTISLEVGWKTLASWMDDVKFWHQERGFLAPWDDWSAAIGVEAAKVRL